MPSSVEHENDLGHGVLVCWSCSEHVFTCWLFVNVFSPRAVAETAASCFVGVPDRSPGALRPVPRCRRSRHGLFPVIRPRCARRYHGYDQPQPYGSLASTALFAARPIVAVLNKARRTSEDPAFGCPTDLGERIVLVFSYRAGLPVLITVPTGGCEVLTNGVISIWTPTALVNPTRASTGPRSLRMMRVGLAGSVAPTTATGVVG